MTQEDLQELFVEQIRDIYDAEKQLVKALPKLAKAVESEALSEALHSHLAETKEQVTRLESVFELLGMKPKGKSCKGMKGLLEEGDEAVQELEGEVRDLAIIAGAQRVEHYEISAYGTARTLAEQLNMTEAVDLLQQTEEEEKEADANLTSVAAGIYETVEESDVEDSEGEDEEEVEDEETAEPVAPVKRRAPARASSTKRASRN